MEILCKNYQPVKSYDEINLTIFVVSLCKKYWWGLTSFDQFTSLLAWLFAISMLAVYMRHDSCMLCAI